MPYSEIVSRYEGPANLEGRTIQALYSEYSFAALQLDNDEVINFAVEEVSVGKWFEVFPICLYELSQDYAFAWKELEVPFTVTSSELLWREEWLESSSDSSEFMGSGPHSTQFAAVLGTAPQSNPDVVKVLAGIRLKGQNGRCLVVSSSDNTPFKIDLATDATEIEHVMVSHTAEQV
jgi:hypothetical protein